MLVVSGLDFSSVFLTRMSFTTGAADADTGEGFCGGFWAWGANKQTNKKKKTVVTLIGGSLLAGCHS